MSFQRNGLAIKDFALGFRFLTEQGEDFTPADAWQLLFEALPAANMEGAELNGLYETSPEGACYVCIFNNLSLARFRVIYPVLEKRADIMSRLVFYRSIYQSNRLERHPADYELLGTVSGDGMVRGGDVSYGNMAFSGPAIEKQKGFVPTVLIAATGFAGVLSQARCTRELMRIAGESFPNARVVPFVLPLGGKGTADALIRSLGGRYVTASVKDGEDNVKETLFGILPDRAVVYEAASEEDAKNLIRYGLDCGYTSFIIDVAGKAAKDVSLSAPDHPRASDAAITIVGTDTDAETFVSLSAFSAAIRNASAVILCDGTPEGDAARAMGDVCAKAHIPAFAVDAKMDNNTSREEAEEFLRARAKELFGTLKAGRRFRQR